MSRIDAGGMRDWVGRAKARIAGRRARLVGFEAVEVQRFVVASRRPIAIQGACEALKSFDRRNEDLPETIFAGGTRGLMLLAEDEVAGQVKALRETFAKVTVGLSLAVTDVPFDPANERGSLEWLRLEQRAVHDECEPQAIDLAAFGRGAACADCRARPGEVPSPKPEAGDEKVCRRCAELIKVGRKTQLVEEERWTFEHVAEDRLLAVVSADGNHLGRFFHSLCSLEALRAGSLAVADLFRTAHDAALDRAGEPRRIAPITGGDDIKVFLPPTAALDYVGALMSCVEDGAKRLGDAGGLLAGEPAKLLAELGIGVGLLVAPFHVPAPRLADLAHELEDKAKEERERASRSAICFAVQRTDGEPDKANRETVQGLAWPELLRRARLLREIVPGGQRAAAAAAWEIDKAERDNQFLYQIARSREWRNWYKECGVDWTKRESALSPLGRKGVFALASLGKRAS